MVGADAKGANDDDGADDEIQMLVLHKENPLLFFIIPEKIVFNPLPKILFFFFHLFFSTQNISGFLHRIF
jgi:hypothetical protein